MTIHFFATIDHPKESFRRFCTSSNIAFVIKNSTYNAVCSYVESRQQFVLHKRVAGIFCIDSVRTDLRSLPYTDSDTGVVVQCPPHMKKKFTKEQCMHEGCWDWGRVCCNCLKRSRWEFLCSCNFFCYISFHPPPVAVDFIIASRTETIFMILSALLTWARSWSTSKGWQKKPHNCQREILNPRCSVEAFLIVCIVMNSKHLALKVNTDPFGGMSHS